MNGCNIIATTYEYYQGIKSFVVFIDSVQVNLVDVESLLYSVPAVSLTQCLFVWQPDVAYFYYWSDTSIRVRLGTAFGLALGLGFRL